MSSRFFIERPVFASVIAIVIVIAGLVAYLDLPVARYPDISPPTVKVKAVYPGANAKVVADTVAQPIEEQINGVQDMLYMYSNCANTGEYELTVVFEIGTDLDMASVRVQNRVNMAEPMLPEDVRRQGVTTKKESTNLALLISLTSPDGRFDLQYLSNYASIFIKDELARLKGVGDVHIFGAGDYSMRVWLDPDKLKARGLTGLDVANAIREQNVQVAAGMIGQPPAPTDQDFQYVVNVKGRLSDPAEFGNIVVKAEGHGRLVRIKDVARVELGTQIYDSSAQSDGNVCAALGIYQLPGSNLVEVVERVKARLDELSPGFPEGMEHVLSIDMTLSVKESMAEVKETILIAAALVLLVILVFLQDWRATLIPAITIPVSLIGTFAVMSALGFSLNMVTLFGIVLAIGIVVDDAIVVVENAVRHINTYGRSPKEAAIEAMKEVSSPIVAMTLVLMAVFIPVAFVGGITGELYRQFALTIAASAAISGINALTLSPALCAIFLRKPKGRGNVLSRAFNWSFGKTTGAYAAVAGLAVRRSLIAMVLYLGMAAAGSWGYVKLPTGFLPTEDEAIVFLHVQLPDGTSKQRAQETIEQVNESLAQMEGIEHYVMINGYSLLDSGATSNICTGLLTLTHWDERQAPHLQLDPIVGRLFGEFGQLQDASVFVFTPPPVMGLGIAGGFKAELQDRAGVGYDALQTMAEDVVEAANTQSQLQGVFTSFRATTPQRFVDIDRDKVKSLGLPLSSVFAALQANFGSFYVNDFNKFGKTYQVRLQAEPDARNQNSDVGRLEVPGRGGRMIPLSTLVNVTDDFGPQFVRRHNMYPCASISGRAAPGSSSGEALSLMENIAHAKLPPSMGFDWTEVSFQEKRGSGQGVIVLMLAVVFVYLVLCALYESWSLPISVILIVPSALLGTVVAVALRGLDVNVFTQIGLIVLIALASKNAILIVEFARDLRASGKPILASAIEAARVRFRPVLMTALTFVVGVCPLAIASGAGANSRQALGTAVFGGMISATVLSVLFVPVFYVIIQRLSELIRPKHAADGQTGDSGDASAVAEYTMASHEPNGSSGEGVS